MFVHKHTAVDPRMSKYKFLCVAEPKEMRIAVMDLVKHPWQQKNTCKTLQDTTILMLL